MRVGVKVVFVSVGVDRGQGNGNVVEAHDGRLQSWLGRTPYLG